MPKIVEDRISISSDEEYTCNGEGSCSSKFRDTVIICLSSDEDEIREGFGIYFIFILYLRILREKIKDEKKTVRKRATRPKNKKKSWTRPKNKKKSTWYVT